MASIAQLGEHCTGIAEVVGSNPARSLEFFSGLCFSSSSSFIHSYSVTIQQNKKEVKNRADYTLS